MDHTELQKRLQDLGAAIPEGTLRRWASEELIPGPTPYYEKREKKARRPTFKDLSARKETRGRHMNWPKETVEAAAAVWMIRNCSFPQALSYNKFKAYRDNYLPSDAQREKRNVPNDIVKRIKENANNLHTMLTTDCKKASRFLRTYLCPNGFPSQENKIFDRLVGQFNANPLDPYIISWIATVNKVRYQIQLDKPIFLQYNWIIDESGQSEFQALRVTQPPIEFDAKIELRVTHLKPLENGYSTDYGFPKFNTFMKCGFVDVFSLREIGVIKEHFYLFKTEPRSKNLDYIHQHPNVMSEFRFERKFGDIYYA